MSGLPAIARLLLRLGLPQDERASIAAELEESARARFESGRVRVDGPRREPADGEPVRDPGAGLGARARLWIVKEAAALSLGFAVERWRERRARLRRIEHPHGAPLRGNRMSNWIRDLGFAVRLILKQPGFTAAVLVTLALGIGPNTAVFSVVNAVLLRPLPYEEPEQLALIRVDLSGLERHPGIARAEVLDFRSRAGTFADVGAVSRGFTASIGEGDSMEAVQAANVTPNLFPLLGVTPIVGRQLDPSLEVPDSERGAMISHALWERRYGADPDVVGESIRVNGNAVRVYGVMPQGFQLLLGPGTSLPADVDLWMTLVLDPDDRGFWAYRTIARVRAGVAMASAEAELQQVGEQVVSEFPDAYANSGIRFYLHPLHDDLVGPVRPAILALLGAVGLVLLIACTNAAGLLLARTKARERELAMRSALGARRSDITRQVLIESLVLALLAGGLGLVLGSLGLQALLGLQPGNIPRVDGVQLDRTVLAFTLGASMLASLAFGIFPALAASRPDVQDSLKQGGRVGGSIHARARSVLVVAQVALSLMLLVGAGLMIRTFSSLRQIDLGFEPRAVVTMQAPLDFRAFQAPEERWEAYRALTARVAGASGIEAVGGVSFLPLSNQNMMASFSLGGELADDNWNGTNADYRSVLPGYFEAMGIRVLAGRSFRDADNGEIVPVAVIDETLAELLWPGENAIGKQLQLGLGSQLDDGQPVDVIGVVEHSRIIDVRRDVRPQIYLPYRLRPGPLALVARTSGDPLAAVGSIRAAVADVGLGRPIHTVRTMEAYVDDALGDTRFTLMLMSALAAIAALLSAVGIYSVIAFLVRQRAHETGIRMALGAERREVLTMNLRAGFRLAVAAVPFGIAGALVLTRFLESILYGVAATDPTTYVAIPLLLVGVALMASWIPAYRASRTDPAVVLRDQ